MSSSINLKPIERHRAAAKLIEPVLPGSLPEAIRGGDDSLYHAGVTRAMSSSAAANFGWCATRGRRIPAVVFD